MQKWVNADVHSWSKQMSQTLMSEMPQLVREADAAVARGDPASIKRALPPKVWCVVDKITGRKGVKDADLCGMDPFGLLQVAWEVTPRDADGDRALTELLEDINGTCLQGDTHRLFFYVHAVRLSRN
jgi:hypothetical protein